MIDRKKLNALTDQHLTLLYHAAHPGVLAIRPSTPAERRRIGDLTAAGLLREQEPSPTKWEDPHGPVAPSWSITVHGSEYARAMARIDLGIDKGYLR